MSSSTLGGTSSLWSSKTLHSVIKLWNAFISFKRIPAFLISRSSLNKDFISERVKSASKAPSTSFIRKRLAYILYIPESKDCNYFATWLALYLSNWSGGTLTSLLSLLGAIPRKLTMSFNLMATALAADLSRSLSIISFWGAGPQLTSIFMSTSVSSNLVLRITLLVLVLGDFMRPTFCLAPFPSFLSNLRLPSLLYITVNQSVKPGTSVIRG